YNKYCRRYPTVDSLNVPRFRGRSIYGYVAHVGDGDNFRLYHMPGGRLLGWGWFPGRRVRDFDTERWWWSKTTIHVRIAGIDAPELSHFGKDAQPYGQEALDWLKGHLLHTHVRAYPYSRDRFDRVVSTVYQRRLLFFKSDVGYNMIRSGLATVYEAKVGSEFGGKEDEYRAAEAYARQRKVGMWQKAGLVGRLLGKKQSLETPREYKTRTAKEEQVKK
ncbi:SNase-domain-containing protein, partial [Teratosphaeria nubilosa]